MRARLGVAFLASLLAVGLSLVTPEARQPAATVVPDEVIVKFRPGVSDFQRTQVLTARSARRLRRFRALDLEHVRLNPGQNLAIAIAALRSSPSVALVQPNFIRRVAAPAPPNDQYWTIGLLWGMERIQAQPVWTNITNGSPDVVVADIDSGVDYTHPDLAANMWVNPGEVPGNGVDDDGNGYVDDVHGIDASNGDSDPMDDHGHGTHTAGTIGATGDNGVGVVGVAWGSRILACKFLDSAGSGTDAGAIECFNYLVALKQRGVNIRVSNNSWGGLREGAQADVLKAAIDEAGAVGILNVFAAGNAGANNDQMPFDPAGFDSPSILVVAASNSADNRASFSNYGATSVDIAAPGDFIVSTSAGSYTFSSGTSMAAPHVSGAAALLASKDPSLSVDAMKTVLMATADVLPQWAGLTVTGGRLNVLNAATAAGGNIPPSVTVTSPASGAAFPVSTVVTLEATTQDIDGNVSQVAFYANGALIATDTTGPAGLFTTTWTSSIAGTFDITAVATDDGGATRTSSPVSVTLTPPAGRMNVALAANGAVAVASSANGASFPPNAVIDGDRRGLNWGSGGGWEDGTSGVWPDWFEVEFDGPRLIEEIDVVTVQDSYGSPSEPTLGMTFTRYGLQDFVVEYWTGSEWAAVPGGNVLNNTRVWRQFNFVPLTTSRIRVFVTRSLGSRSRLIEIEAYAVVGTVNQGPSVTITSPATGASFPVSTPVTLAAAASDANGSVSRVDFYVNGVLEGSDSTGVQGIYTSTWTSSLAGAYTLTAVATDDVGATRTSSPVTVTLTPLAGRINVALASNGGSAVASTTNSSNFPASAVINGDRRGLSWGNGGGWEDGTSGTWPDWFEVHFAGAQMIEEIDVFTVQDSYTSPGVPTLGMTFTKYGLQDFVVEYWTGNAWQPVPGGSVTNNTRVWRQFSFVPVNTSRIRVFVSRAAGSRSRLVEIEAYAVFGAVNQLPDVAVTSPANGSEFAKSTPVTLEATASDPDGSVSQVAFYVNGIALGTDLTGEAGKFSMTWNSSLAGTYEVTAVATDDRGATKTSSPITIALTPPAGRTNVALASNGGTATASTAFSGGFPASSVINGDRKGLSWGSGGGWQDGTDGVWPDWLEVQFSGPQTIEEIDVFSVQDTYTAPSEPTIGMTFTTYGLQDFVVEYWTGSAWEMVSGGSVLNNTRVWRQFNFAPVTTARIRVWVTRALASRSRLVEIEAYAVWGSINEAPTVTMTSPSTGATFPVSTSVSLQATATDVDGTVSQVKFYANDVLVATDMTGLSGVFSTVWTPSIAGTYTVTAEATDDRGGVKTSSPISVVMAPPAGRTNVALASNGGFAVASSTFSPSFPVSSVINGDRRGLSWGSGGGWQDGTDGAWPDWVEVQFTGPRTIEEIDVFTVQDTYTAPGTPTLGMTFTKYGLQDFVVEYWTGSAWQPVPGGVVVNNTRVWRQFNFAPVTTSRIRVLVTRALASKSRLVEVEVYAAIGG